MTELMKSLQESDAIDQLIPAQTKPSDGSMTSLWGPVRDNIGLTAVLSLSSLLLLSIIVSEFKY